VHILHGDGGEEKREEVGEESGCILDLAHGTQGDFFAIDRGGGGPFVLQGFVFCSSSVAEGESEDRGTQVGVDGGFVAGYIELKLALGFGDYTDEL
jgi:hypothetical protein